MSKKSIHISYTEINSDSGLDPADLLLLKDASRAMGNAYSPYSMYRVGCAVKMENGETITGNNQENMAYPSGLCAERVALFTAKAKYPGVPVESIAIVASPAEASSSLPSASCGACRQVMMEYEMIQDKPFRVLFRGVTGPVIIVDSVKDLLPLHFREDGLRRS